MFFPSLDLQSTDSYKYHSFFKAGESWKPDACQNCSCSLDGKVTCRVKECLIDCPAVSSLLKNISYTSCTQIELQLLDSLYAIQSNSFHST